MLGPLYVQEKLREMELERAMARQRRRSELRPPAGPRGPRRRRPTAIAFVARTAGRALRRLGSGLEAWGTASGAQTLGPW